MIENYGLYNNHQLDNSVLIIFSSLKANKEKNIGEVDILYHDEEIVGYRIKNFIRYAKIKYSGIIFLPAPILIDVINSILAKYQLELLAYRLSSGYVTKKNNNHMMVFATPGTYLRDQSISKGKYCSYYDLDIKIENDKDLFIIDEDIKENVDFFLTEEK